MYATYESLAPTWLKVFKDHTLINGLNADPDDVPAGYCLKFIHSSQATLKKMLGDGNYGQRYIFDSLCQCVAHQVSHHHYGLSTSTLRDDSVIIQLYVQSDWVESNGHPAVNGYCYSTVVDTLPVEICKISGCAYLQQSLSQFLASDLG
eukprot:5528921-Amphidinium_carterae.1